MPEHGTHLRVLMVEDSGDDALLLLRELRRGGYEPDLARGLWFDQQSTIRHRYSV